MTIVSCKFCNSDRVIKYGTTAAGNQNYLCKQCDRRFSSDRKAGRPTGTKKDKPAEFCGCGKSVYSKGLCQACYRKLRRSHGKD